MDKQELCWLSDNCKKLHCNDANGCLIKYKLEYLYKEANISEALRVNKPLHPDIDGTDLDKFTKLKEIKDNIVDFVSGGNQLLIYSKITGNGKTSWSIKLLQAYFNKIWLSTPLKCRALFINVPSYLLGIKENLNHKVDYIEHIKKNVLECDLVIWDDISNKTGTDFEINNLLSIIDTRISNGKANIYTSNIEPDELKNYLDIRLGSRIANASIKIGLNGGDKREVSVKVGEN